MRRTSSIDIYHIVNCRSLSSENEFRCIICLMCGRYQFNFDNPQGFKERFNIEGNFPKAKMHTSYNVLPGLDHPVIVATDKGNSVELMEWGLIPFWEKGSSPRGLINIRAETIREKHWADKYIQTQRVLIPASGFYEPKGPKGPSRDQYYFRLKNTDYFAFAGLYSEFTPPSGESIKSYSIITTSPNEVLAPIHDRMPVILSDNEEESWLNPDKAEKEQLLEFLDSYTAKEMEGWQVSNDVKNPRNDFPELINPLI